VAQVFVGDSKQVAALLPVDRGLGGFYLVGGANFDLDEKQDVVVLPNQVDFAATRGERTLRATMVHPRLRRRNRRVLHRASRYAGAKRHCRPAASGLRFQSRMRTVAYIDDRRTLDFVSAGVPPARYGGQDARQTAPRQRHSFTHSRFQESAKMRRASQGRYFSGPVISSKSPVHSSVREEKRAHPRRDRPEVSP